MEVAALAMLNQTIEQLKHYEAELEIRTRMLKDRVKLVLINQLHPLNLRRLQETVLGTVLESSSSLALVPRTLTVLLVVAGLIRANARVQW